MTDPFYTPTLSHLPDCPARPAARGPISAEP